MKDYEFNNYCVEKYAKICCKFAKDTADWDTLETGGCTFYTTTYNDWKQSCDNAHGGISVRWAFHQSADYINQHAAEELFDMFINDIQNAIDETCDMPQFQAIVDSYNF